MIVAALISRFDSDSDPPIRRACLVYLTYFRQIAPGVLSLALKADPDRSVRRLAAYALGRSGSEKEVDSLLAAVKSDGGSSSDGRDIARVAIGSLGKIGGTNAAKALMEIWESEELSRDCREATVYALGDAGDPGAMDTLENVLAGEQELLRDNAALGLGEIGKHNSQEPIIVNRVVGSLRPCLWDINPKVRANSAYALGWIGGKDDVQMLEGLLMDDYKEVVSYTKDGQVLKKDAFPVRDRAKEAIDRILARTGPGGDR